MIAIKSCGRATSEADHEISDRRRGDAYLGRTLVAFYNRCWNHRFQRNNQIFCDEHHGTSLWHLRSGRCSDSRRYTSKDSAYGHLEDDVLCIPTGRWREALPFHSGRDERGTTSASHRDPSAADGSTHPRRVSR